MSFLEHLEELRQRIITVLVIWAVAAISSYAFVGKILKFIFAPLSPFQQKPVFTRPMEPFMVTLAVCALAGSLVALPVFMAELWLFVSPGLTPKERQFSRWIILSLVVFTLVGMAFGFFLLVPLSLKILLGFSQGVMLPFLSASSYLMFVAIITIGLGVVFNLPVAISALAALGIVKPETLVENRRLAVVGAVVVAAVITPTTDVITQLLLAGPLVILYEIGIIFARIFSRQSLQN